LGKAVRLAAATILMGLSVLINLFGVVMLGLLLLGRSKWLLLAYMGLAVLTIPLFLLVRLLSPLSIWRKTAAERNACEQLFIRLYDANFILAVVVWAVIIVSGHTPRLTFRPPPAQTTGANGPTKPSCRCRVTCYFCLSLKTRKTFHVRYRHSKTGLVPAGGRHAAAAGLHYC
jgi:hypothetical protein